jgi:hypothetical protein
MWANEKSIGLGGGSRGRFGLFLQEDFFKGSSSFTTTFGNEILSSKEDFLCTSLELWGLEKPILFLDQQTTGTDLNNTDAEAKRAMGMFKDLLS